MTITLGTKQFERRELTAVDEAFFNNFLIRRLVDRYAVGIDQIRDHHLQFVLHDLKVIRYRAWLMLRHHNLSFVDLATTITDENAIDIFIQLYAKPIQLVPGAAAETIKEIIDKNKSE